MINRPTTDYVGLIGSLFAPQMNNSTYASESLSNIGMVNARVVGRHYVGALAGQTHYGTTLVTIQPERAA